ncbi:hypothetical protein IMZ11_02835 [Microtetraspora sp. AC03309]|uniref:tyrosine-type recombinase/integrase n=1 Tax=Microtetraspora sp. AC03309 TaxID=2779376 RepID=UPI001E51A6F7|nr:hypothetical protein [Microtetraspora sp. AC03309]MCC5574576.1 hypothetical protein [Microtetraspora sp. AC03309]
MGYAEKRGALWRARWHNPAGKLESMTGFSTKRAAEQYANDQEAAIRAGRYIDPKAGQITVTEWVNIWYPTLDLELTTLENYRFLLQACVLPFFGDRSLASITAEEIAAWEMDLVRVHSYSKRTARDARSTFGTTLAAAVPVRIPFNPAARKRATGKKAERRIAKVMEKRKAWATPLEALLVAERVAVLSGHQSDFVKVMFIAYTGARWSEAVGLDPSTLHGEVIDLDWKLYELNGYFYRGHPKDGSIRQLDVPPFLETLLARHLAEQKVTRCTCPAEAEEPYCAGGEYVFLGLKGGHARRSDFARRSFRPAADGWYAPRGGKAAQPAAPVLADVSIGWPGRVIAPPWPANTAAYPRGRGVSPLPPEAPIVNWLPIMRDLTPHGLRHSHETWMAEDRIPNVLRDERMGHIGDGGMRDHYTHVSDTMRDELKDCLQRRLERSLVERVELERHWSREYGIPPRSPVRLLDEMLEPLRGNVTQIERARSVRALQRATPRRSTPILLPKPDIAAKARGRSRAGNGL